MDTATIAARLEYLTAKALFDGPEKSVLLRVGEEDRILYIDLCDEKWRAIRISPDGWEVVDAPEVFFRRAHLIFATVGRMFRFPAKTPGRQTMVIPALCDLRDGRQAATVQA